MQRRLEANGEAKHSKPPVTDFLLTGLMRCAKCGRHYVGAGAYSKTKKRHRYYTCWTRNRRGAKACDGDLIPADALEAVILSALLDLYACPELLHEAVAESRAILGEGRKEATAELVAAETEIRKAEDAISRYLRASEAGTMSETVCGPRLQELAAQVGDLTAP